jgi:hypothetical protein
MHFRKIWFDKLTILSQVEGDLFSQVEKQKKEINLAPQFIEGLLLRNKIQCPTMRYS